MKADHEAAKNAVQTWAQGYFVDQRQYFRWSKEQKEQANFNESFLVRPGPTDNAICKAATPEEAIWIAERLNLAAKQSAELARLREDAERYRWLRDAEHNWQIGPWIGYEEIDHKDGIDLDAAIDEAMKK